MREKYEVVIVGAGVLGVTIAFWLSCLTKCSIAVLDKEARVAAHTSSRNTGVIHRPFYLNPEKKRVFARAAQKSYFLWRSLARQFQLAWSQVGTLEVAIGDSQFPTLNQYREWALQNGMGEKEVELLDAPSVKTLEPLVECKGAIYSKTDTAVNYGELTSCMSELSIKNGVEFLMGHKVVRAQENSRGVTLEIGSHSDELASIACGFLINAAGGNSMDIAHSMGLAKNYTDLHFRGEYWKVEPEFGIKVMRNIYSVARHTEFPFLDPHFIVRADGWREVGPNAVLVSGPNAYTGLSSTKSELLKKLVERPNYPKLRLFSSSQFLSLVWQEWRSSISKQAMCNRVRRFIPTMRVAQLRNRGLSGVRSSVIDRSGFVSEAVVIERESSLHILNYNSPGATGAPAYSAYLVGKLLAEGRLKTSGTETAGIAQKIGWDFASAADL